MQLGMVKQCSLFLIISFFAVGCAQTKIKFQYQEKQNSIIWPAPPEVPRYQYVGVITGEQNFIKQAGSGGFARRGINWLGKVIFGEEAPRSLYRPQSGVVDPENQRLYVTDIGSKAVFVFDMKSKTLHVWENADQDNSFVSPIGICLMGPNNVFVSDAELGIVSQFDAEGQWLAKIDNNSLKRPTGIACDPVKKRIYVADSQRHLIAVFSEAGKLLFKFGTKGSSEGKFNSPTHLSFANNTLYVSDTLNARVQMFDAEGKWLSSFGQRGMYVGNLPRPKGVAVDSENHIYVMESFYDFMLVFDKTGRPLLPIGGNGSGPGEFYLPAGIWIDDSDKIYVADMFNSRVVVFQYLSEHVNRIRN